MKSLRLVITSIAISVDLHLAKAAATLSRP